MPERIYTGNRVDGDVDLQYRGSGGYPKYETLEDVINTQNERIAALESQVAQLVAKCTASI